MTRERLHKILAAAGIASRRRCEELITEGHVSIDGVEVRHLGVTVDPEVQEIRFDDEVISIEKPVYFAVHKPGGYLCTNFDEFGRRTVISLVRDKKRRRLYTVGRLDEDSEGLILVTNDGDFANRVAHPRYGLEKTYDLKLRGFLNREDLDRVRKGVWLSTGRTQSMYVRILKRGKQFTQVRVVIHEGKNRQLRRVFAKIGHPVALLKRVRIGPIDIRGIKKGESCLLRKDEVEAIEKRLTEIREQGGHSPAPRRRSEFSERWSGEKETRKHKTQQRRRASDQRREDKRRPQGGRGNRDQRGRR